MKHTVGILSIFPTGTVQTIVYHDPTNQASMVPPSMCWKCFLHMQNMYVESRNNLHYRAAPPPLPSRCQCRSPFNGRSNFPANETPPAGANCGRFAKPPTKWATIGEHRKEVMCRLASSDRILVFVVFVQLVFSLSLSLAFFRSRYNAAYSHYLCISFCVFVLVSIAFANTLENKTTDRDAERGTLLFHLRTNY